MAERHEMTGLTGIEQHRKLPRYPSDHKVGMRVPPGGSNCSKCEYVRDVKNDKGDCAQRKFVQWNGSHRIPLPVELYCCDFFEEK